ncbi:Arginine--tRNA ligase [bacterium AB1]|nr:Arginine--tRNA ligase [bacterium AB1]
MSNIINDLLLFFLNIKDINFKVSKYDNCIYESLYFKDLEQAKNFIIVLNKLLFFSFVLEKNFINIRLNKISIDLFIFYYKKHFLNLNNKNIILDCIGLNVGKSAHFGHLRNVLLSKVIYKELVREGYNVLIDTHIGDYGSTLFKFINYFYINKYSIVDVEKYTIEDLTNIYLSVGDVVNDGFVDKVDEEYISKMHNILLCKTKEYIKNIAFLLKVNITFYYGEYRYIKSCDNLYTYLQDKKIAYLNKDNNQLVTINNLSLTRSNGTYLYAFTDIATLYERYDKKYYACIYCVDIRQKQHFNMLFDFYSHMQNDHDMKLLYIGYGFVKNESNNVYKSRESSNNIILYLEKMYFLYKQLLYIEETITLSLLLYEIRHITDKDYMFLVDVFSDYIKLVNNFVMKMFEIQEKYCLSKDKDLLLEKIEVIFNSNFKKYTFSNIDEQIFILLLKQMEYNRKFVFNLFNKNINCNLLYTHFYQVVNLIYLDKFSGVNNNQISDMLFVLTYSVFYYYL